MEWEELFFHIQGIKENFKKSYKCVTLNRNIKKEILNKHAKILVDSFNEARILVHVNRANIGKTNWSKIFNLLIKLRANLARFIVQFS